MGYRLDKYKTHHFCVHLQIKSLYQRSCDLLCVIPWVIPSSHGWYSSYPMTDPCMYGIGSYHLHDWGILERLCPCGSTKIHNFFGADPWYCLMILAALLQVHIAMDNDHHLNMVSPLKRQGHFPWQIFSEPPEAIFSDEKCEVSHEKNPFVLTVQCHVCWLWYYHCAPNGWMSTSIVVFPKPTCFWLTGGSRWRFAKKWSMSRC